MGSILLLLAGLILLVGGAELLVKGATQLARAIGVPPLVIGLTVVAYGTSAPELAVSTLASMGGRPDIAIGNVVGSNIFNVLFILGLAAIIAPLRVSSQLIRSDVPLMIAASFGLLVFARDGAISRVEGALLFGAVIFYTVSLIVEGRRETASAKAMVAATEPTEPPVHWLRAGAFVAGGLVLLVTGASWLVSGATVLARMMGVSELVIGLTIVAGGTSLPELATSVLAGIRGQREMAIGNVVGSCIFNILCIVGISSMVHPMGVAPAVINFDLPLMIAVAVACLPIFFTRGQVGRFEGVVLLLYYVAYVLYLILSSTSHDALPAFSRIMAGFVVPLTALGLAVAAWYEVRRPSTAG